MTISRRTLLTAVPAAFLTAPVFAASLPRQGPLAFAGATRIKAPLSWSTQAGLVPELVEHIGQNGSHILSLKTTIPADLPAYAALGLTFPDLPGFQKGVAFWRYAPWKAWTKPMAMTHPADMESDDIQFAYWQYADGAYGVALPLGGGGFRTTLGARAGAMATLCRALASARTDRLMPQVAIGFGHDLYVTITNLFEDAMTALATPQNLRRNKILPEALTWLGWNTWNASNLGQNLSADWVVQQVDTIRAAGVPIRTVVFDDGHFQARDGCLQSQQPDPIKFPNGFKPVVDRLLGQHGMKHVGLWHAFDAYWNGIDPDSALGKSLQDQMFSWTQKPSPVDTSGKLVTYSFLKPDPAQLDAYFDHYHAGLKAAGFSLIKVDNQLVAERMAKDNYPIWDLAIAMHDAINKGAETYFDNAMINCMDMTNDAFLNFGASAVARSVEDYFPYKPSEGYDLQEGNAAAHVLQAMYNALYFGEMVFPDFDMFESTNPNAQLHAAVRAANCAPIYITDKAGQHNVALLDALVDSVGHTLRADTPLRPTSDCLFQIQSPALFKASSRTGDGGLLLLMNLADAEQVSGAWHLSDITDLPRGDYAVWSPAMTAPARIKGGQVALARFGIETLCVAPISNGVAVFGLMDKLNPLASFTDVRHTPDGVSLNLRDKGTLILYSERPLQALQNGRKVVCQSVGASISVRCESAGPLQLHIA